MFTDIAPGQIELFPECLSGFVLCLCMCVCVCGGVWMCV